MTSGQKALAIGACAVTVGLLIVAPAMARDSHGFGGRFHMGHDGHGGPNPGANSQCLQNCGQLDALCLGTARVDAQSCSDTTCTKERQAAKDACSADHTSTACQSAYATLRTCLQPCRDTLNTAVGDCKSSRQMCVTACATSVPSQPDPQCIAACRTTLQTCRQTGDSAAQGCFTDCDAAVTAAENACATNPGASACTTALQTATTCVRGCSQAEQSAGQACLQAAQTCIAACPNVTPTPAPTATPTSGNAPALRLHGRP